PPEPPPELRLLPLVFGEDVIPDPEMGEVLFLVLLFLEPPPCWPPCAPPPPPCWPVPFEPVPCAPEPVPWPVPVPDSAVVGGPYLGEARMNCARFWSIWALFRFVSSELVSGSLM